MYAFKKRFVIIIAFLTLSFGLLIGRLFHIQIIDGWRYSERSRNQSKVRTIVEAKRGNIRDCNGNILARSISSRLFLNDDMLAHSAEGGMEGTQNKHVHSSPIKRIYPYGELTSTVLGYVGKDGYGLAGIEFYFD